jgi:Predicted phosphohydrolases
MPTIPTTALAENPERFNFAHLSDIHFAGYAAGAVFDLESDIRNELVLDLQQLVERAGPLDALLIGGDIAGKGKAGEYEVAERWITELCGEFAIPTERVYCVPGNHDVDQQVIKDDPVLRTIQDSLLECRIDEIDARLEALLGSGDNRALLLSALEPYNQFAARYECDMSISDLYWEQGIPFGAINLQLIGLASPIISGPADVRDPDASRLAIGPQPRMIHRARDTFIIVLCHHPPSWLRDRESAEPFLRRAHLQLYGHQHTFNLGPSGVGLRIDAGAVHPARDEDPWRPSYNLVSLRADGGDASKVTVDIYPRRLMSEMTFGPMSEGEDMSRQTISVKFEQTPGAPPVPLAAPPSTTTLDERALAQRYVSLSPDLRLQVGGNLGLLEAADDELPEGARLRKIFQTARTRGRLAELKEELGV